MGFFYSSTFDAERFWRAPDLSSLPSIKDDQFDNIVSVLDEMQVVFCNQSDDVLFTRLKMNDVQKDLLLDHGFFINNEFLFKTIDEFNGHNVNENICKLLVEEKNDNLKVCSNFENKFFSPYAVDQFSHEFCDEYKLNVCIPPAEVVKRVNSKYYSFHIMKEFYNEYKGELVNSSEEFIQKGGNMLRNCKLFLIKDTYGVSGKGNLLIDSSSMLNIISRQLIKQERSGKKIQFIIEPFLHKQYDFSTTFTIAPDGSYDNYSVQILDNNSFSFSGITEADKVTMSYLEKANYFEFIEKVSKELFKSGYFGPICIDSMILKNGDVLPVIEINARKSMNLISTCIKNQISSDLDTYLLAYSIGISEKIYYQHFFSALKSKKMLYHKNGECGIIPLTSSAFDINVGHAHNGIRKGRLYIVFVYKNDKQKQKLKSNIEQVFYELDILNYS